MTTTGAGQAPTTAGAAAEDSRFGSGEQLRWFVTLWVMAAALHYTDSKPGGAWLILALGLPALLFPANPWAIGMFLVTAAADALFVLPTPANHKMVSLFVVFAFAGAALWAGTTHHRGGPFLARWLGAARSPAGLTLLVVYFFTVFHKLNTGFFDPEASCAGHLLEQMARLNGLGQLELGPIAVIALAVGTVVVEAAILIMLALPRLRPWGLMLGIGFHAALAPASFWDFATMVYALYVLLVPARVFSGLARRFTVARCWAFGAFAVHMIMSTGASYTGSELSPYGLTWHTLQVLTWYAIVAPLMLPLLAACLRDRTRRNDPTSTWPGWRWRPVPLLVVPLLVVLNGATPYLGFKTVANYSMFANLHTEHAAANHLLPGLSVLQLADYQRDLVTVMNIQLPPGTKKHWAKWMKERPPVTIPWLELRRVVGLWRGAGIRPVRVDYLRDGRPHSVADGTADPELGAPLPFWQRGLLAFRAIDSGDGADRCRW